MALSITLNSIVFTLVNDRNVIRSLQPQTISSALEPGRSTYGTFQQIRYPSTVTKKYLWVLQEVYATVSQVTSLESMIENNSTLSYSFTDKLYPVLRSGSELSTYTTTVRILTNGEWIGPCSYSPSIGAKVWPVSFTLIEI